MILVSKAVYIDRLDDIVNKENNTYHRTIKMKPIYVKTSGYIDFDVQKVIKIQNLKLGTMMFLIKIAFQIGQTFLLSKKSKILYYGRTLLLILTVKKLMKSFMRKNRKIQTKQSLG